MTDTQDAIRDLINRMIAAASREGGFTECVALEVEKQWRMEYRGLEISVSSRPRPAERTKEAAVTDYLANMPINEVTERHGISRSSLYRYLKR